MCPQAIRVLVVDDDETIRQVLRLMLDLENYRVVAARNGADALALAAKEPPDVVLLDVTMPGMDGLEVCRRMKYLRTPPRVVMLSAIHTRETERASVIAGADAFLRKPFSPLELLSIIEGAQAERTA